MGKKYNLDVIFGTSLTHDQLSNKRASDFIGDGVSSLTEFIKFSSGKNDLKAWIETNRMIYGKQFSYENSDVEMHLAKRDKQILTAPRPYLTQFINDPCKDKSTIKCRQSEFTENEINENIWLSATIPYFNTRHIFPTGGMALKIAKEKISPACDNSPNIARLLKKPLSFQSKEFINGSFYTIDSSWSDHGGRGPSSDKLTFDEYESQNPQIEEIYSESTSHSKYGRRSRISTPVLPNSGIDEKFNQGCQYEWHITCPKCKQEQIMTFPDNIINFFEESKENMNSEAYLKKIDKVYIGCKLCAAQIDKTSKFYLKTSRWIPKYKHLVPIKASYRVTYLMLAWKTAKEILAKYHGFKFVHQFWNEIMGYAFVDPSAILTRDLFEKRIDPSFKNVYRNLGMARNVSIGIDWGKVSWLVVRGNGFEPAKKHSKIIYVERIDKESLREHGYEGLQTDHVKRAEEVARFFKARIIINDANGIGCDRNEYLAKVFPTKSYGCFYDTDEIQKNKRKVSLIEPTFSDVKKTVTVSRLMTFKSLIREYEDCRVTLPQLDPMVELFIQHHVALVFQKMVDNKTGQIFEIVGHIGPDHFGHADNYAKIGFDKMVNTLKESSAGAVNKTDTNAGVPIEKYTNPDLA